MLRSTSSVTFNDGETSKDFPVQILNENQVEGNQTFSLLLSNASGGATLIGPATVPVTIIDDDIGVSFSSPLYGPFSETVGFVSLAVFRQNGTNGQTTVQFATTNLALVTSNLVAQPGINYSNNTGTLTFYPGQTATNIIVQVLHDTNVTGNVSFGVVLFGPTPTNAQVGPFGSATVVLLDAEAGLSFASTNLSLVTNPDLTETLDANYGVLKSSGTNLLITVLRSNVNTGHHCRRLCHRRWHGRAGRGLRQQQGPADL